MSNMVHVLCYHRVVAEKMPIYVPYFRRGTAVSLTVFRQHIQDIREHFECLNETRALAVLKGTEELRRPGCWITFDDAYVDVLDSVSPVLEDARMPASVFVSTAVLDGDILPVDRWYATLTTAKRRRGTMPDSIPWQFDLDDPISYGRFIDGPEKRRFLRSTPIQQEETLLQLAAALDAGSNMPEDRLYLNVVDLQNLLRQGWSVGSHTVSHSILVNMTGEQQQHELKASRTRLCEVQGSWPRTIAYPDGEWDDTVANQARDAGYEGALTLETGSASANSSIFAIPRVLARNDPNFVRTLVSKRN